MAYIEKYYDPMQQPQNTIQTASKPSHRFKQFIATVKLFWIKARNAVHDLVAKQKRHSSTTPHLTSTEDIGHEVTKALLTNIIASRTQEYNAKLRQPNMIVPEVYSSVLRDSATNNDGSIGYLSFYGRRVLNHLIVLSYKEDIKSIDELDSVVLSNVFSKIRDLDARYKSSNTETITLWRNNNDRLSIEYLVVQENA